MPVRCRYRKKVTQSRTRYTHEITFISSDRQALTDKPSIHSYSRNDGLCSEHTYSIDVAPARSQLVEGKKNRSSIIHARRPSSTRPRKTLDALQWGNARPLRRGDTMRWRMLCGRHAYTRTICWRGIVVVWRANVCMRTVPHCLRVCARW